MATTDTDNAVPETQQGQNTSNDQSSDAKKGKKKKEDKYTNGKDDIVINPDMDKVNEAADKTLVLAWGRMNPPTIGHEKLIKKVVDIARQNRGIPHVMLTHTQDKKKNPLEYQDKINLAKKAFGNMVMPSTDRTLIDALKSHQSKANKIIMVAGSDRVKEYETLLNKYNGKDYNYDSIQVVSAGERDPDADGAEGMSASKMREAAQKNDIRSFTRGLPSKLKTQAKQIFDMVRAGMQLAEELEAEGLDQLDERVLDIAQRRKRALVMRRYKSKIKRAREIAKKRMAKEKNLRVRAQRMARKIVRKRVAGQRGVNYQSLATADKMAIDKMVDKKQALIQRLAKKLYPRVKTAELKRLVKARSGNAVTKINASYDPEYINMVIEQMNNYEVNEIFEALYEAEVKSAEALAATKQRKEDDLEQRSEKQQVKKKIIDEDNYVAYLESIFEEAEDRLLEGAVSDTRDRHKAEIVRMKDRHDRELDRARMADTKEKNTQTESVKLANIELKSEKYGIEYSILEQVYNRGLQSYESTNKNMTAEQFAFARVNSYCTKGRTYYTLDSDLHESEVDPKLQERINSARDRLIEQLEQEKVKLREGKDNIRTLGRMADLKYRIEHIEDEYETFDSNKLAELVFEAMKPPSEQQKKEKLRRLAKMGLVEPEEYAQFDQIMNRIQSAGGDTDKLNLKQKAFLSKIYDKLTDVIAADPTVFQKYRTTLQRQQRENS